MKKTVTKARRTVVKHQHQMVIAKMAENGGKVGTAMREVGYSPGYVDEPQKLTRTKSFQTAWAEHLDKYNLNPDRYFKKLDAAIDAEKWNDFTGEREQDYKTQLPFHTKLGKLLKIEQEDKADTNINVSVTPIYGAISVQGYDRDSKDIQANQTD